jgi:hypothetical protein
MVIVAVYRGAAAATVTEVMAWLARYDDRGAVFDAK